MLHRGVLCILLLAITAAAAAEDQSTENSVTSVINKDKIISRREAIILDNSPIESKHAYRQPTKVIYRRVSRPRPNQTRGPRKPKYGPPKPKYGPPKAKYGPPKHKHGPPKPGRHPPKKHRGKPVKTKYTHAKSRPPKKQYPTPSKYNRRPMYEHSKPHAPYIPQEPAGFGEPPSDHSLFKNPKPSYGEPPTDSYGAPLSFSQGYSYKPNSFESDSYSNYSPQSQSHNVGSGPATASSYSNYAPEPSYAASSYSHQSFGSNYDMGNDDPISATSNLQSSDFSGNMNYGSQFEYDETIPRETHSNTKPPQYSNHQSSYMPVKDNRIKHVVENTNSVNRPRKVTNGRLKQSDEVIVGGQYAEPPARYAPKFKPSAQMYVGDNSFFPPRAMALDSDDSASSHHSSYVNYKNSNMAFSPQNLNDAFSITA